MREKKFLIQFFIITLVQSASLYGQSMTGAPTILPWEIGFSTGVSSFVNSRIPNAGTTENSINYWYNNLNPGIGLSLKRNISPAFGLEFDWLNTRLTGRWNDKWPPHPISVGHESPLTYNSGINQFDLMMTFNLNQILLPGDEVDPWHFFVKTGIGISSIKDFKKFYDESNYRCLGIPIDVGISVSLSQRLKLLIGSNWRLVKTDHLDGVHVLSSDLNSGTTEFKNIFEIYNFSYLRISYGFGHYSSKNSKDIIKF